MFLDDIELDRHITVDHMIRLYGSRAELDGELPDKPPELAADFPEVDAHIAECPLCYSLAETVSVLYEAYPKLVKPEVVEYRDRVRLLP